MSRYSKNNTGKLGEITGSSGGSAGEQKKRAGTQKNNSGKLGKRAGLSSGIAGEQKKRADFEKNESRYEKLEV